MNAENAFNTYGFSFGFLVTGVGIMNLLIASLDVEFNELRKIVILNSGITFILLTVSILFLFYITILSMLSALLLFLASLIQSSRDKTIIQSN